jgi:pre-mRNA-splicing factor ATP-dependent RNA helicase DHX38/PRP16
MESKEGGEHDSDGDEKQFDRDFYDQDEGGAVDPEKDPFLGYSGGRGAPRQPTIESPSTTTPDASGGKDQARRLGARRFQANEDSRRWEESQLIGSGVVRQVVRTAAELAGGEESEARVHLIVHDTRPPFLEGERGAAFFKKKLSDPVYPVKDPTSDMAVIARQGSQLVREVRERREREKGSRERVSLAGTKLGDMLGVKKVLEDDDADSAIAGPDAGSRRPSSSSAYGQHATKRAEAVSDFARMHTLAEQRRLLPVYQCRRDLMKIIGENQVVVVVGETGSGKTTQLAQYLNEDGYSRGGRLCVGCTQPRRVAAMSVAKRVSEEMGCDLGGVVGYSIRFEDVTSERTTIKYMTDGVLLRESLKDPLLERYSVIIMDEAHERSLHTDVLFGVLRRVAAQRTDLKLVITSATMDADKFALYFGNAPTFKIPGRTFPVELMHSRAACADPVDAAVKQALAIHVSHPPGDILVFMTG